MYKEYFLEEYGRDTLEADCGFCMYILSKEASEVYITDFYVKPEFRKSYEGKKMFTQVVELAKENDCAMITAAVYLDPNNLDLSARKLKTYQALGFIPFETYSQRNIKLAYQVENGKEQAPEK